MYLQQHFSLKKYNSFGIEAVARYFSPFKNVEELTDLLNSNSNSQTPPLILGGGSNILFTKDFDGLVLKNEIAGIEKIKEDEDYVYVTAGAGVGWHAFVLYCLENDYAGVENLSLIPGNTGAGPMQNIGAYGVEIKDIFHSLEAFHLKEKKIINFNLADCEFDYRESVFKNKFKNQFVITAVTFRLNKKPVYNITYGAIKEELESMKITSLTIKSISRAVINIRRSKLPDPAEIGNAGSFFKNPEITKDEFIVIQNNFPGIIGYQQENGEVKIPAGWLVEQCGWKGYRRGDAGCHARQALVLVNYGNASGAEIFSLSEEIIISVKIKFGITLQREVNIF